MKFTRRLWRLGGHLEGRPAFDGYLEHVALIDDGDDDQGQWASPGARRRKIGKIAGLHQPGREAQRDDAQHGKAGQRRGKEADNVRSGTWPKTVLAESGGEVGIGVSRDRVGGGPRFGRR